MKNIFYNIIASFLLLLCMNFIAFGFEWKKVDVGYSECRIDFVHTIGKYQLAFERNGTVYRREAGKKKWNTVVTETDSFPMNTSTYPSYSLQIINGNGAIFADDDHSTFYSKDSGATWSENFPSFDLLLKGDITYHPYGSHWFAIRKSDVYHSQDMSQSWDTCLTDDNGDEFFKVTVGKYYTWVGGWGKVYRSYSSINWECYTEGLPERCAVRTIKGISDSVIIASTDLGLYISLNKGESWKVLDDTFSEINKKVAQEILVLDSIAIIVTTDKAYCADLLNETVTKINLPFNSKIIPQDIDIFDNKLCVVGYEGIYESDNYGLTWGDPIADGLNKKVCILDIQKDNSSLVAKIKVHPYEDANSQTIFSKSDNNGLTWELLNDSIGIDDIKLEEVYHNGDTIFSIFHSLLLRSFNNGISFDTINNKVRPSCNGFLKIGDRVIYSKSKIATSDNPAILTFGQYGDKCISSHTSNYNGIYHFLDTIWTKHGYLDEYSFSLDTGVTWNRYMEERQIHINSIVQSGKLTIGVSDSAMFYSIDRGYEWNELNMPFDILTYNRETNIVPVKKGEPIIIIDSTLFIYNKDEVYSLPVSELTNSIPIQTSSISKSLNFHIINSNKSILLKINLPVCSDFSAKLISMNGKEIKNFNGFLSKGDNQIKLNCAGISNGFYILNFRAKDISFSKSLLLTK